MKIQLQNKINENFVDLGKLNNQDMSKLSKTELSDFLREREYIKGKIDGLLIAKDLIDFN